MRLMARVEPIENWTGPFCIEMPPCGVIKNVWFSVDNDGIAIIGEPIKSRITAVLGVVVNPDVPPIKREFRFAEVNNIIDVDDDIVYCHGIFMLPGTRGMVALYEMVDCS